MASARGRAAQREGLSSEATSRVDPYRSDPFAATRAPAQGDRGIVGEIISQFADPLAFYRELVQNAIDAGSPTVEVRLEYDDALGIARVQVRDRGEGMTRETLENQLLVLFRSTKETDDSKIGKFGIGFTSVLAPEPEVVAVTTSREGRRLTLHLHRDLTYQIFDAGRASQSGTTVELDLKMPRDELAGFAKASRTALARWCRHASVPVTFEVVDGETPDEPVRIDRPLALSNALVEITRETNGGKLAVAVGLLQDAATYAGFFNHGLMLHETTEASHATTRPEFLRGVAFKVQDARLGHTLSRDDVRRDRHFDRALSFVRQIVKRELPRAAATALHAAATAGDLDRWVALASAIAASHLPLSADDWWIPLLPGRHQPAALAASKLRRRAWVATEWSPLAARVIEMGEPVLRADREMRPVLSAMLVVVADCELVDVDRELTSITPIAKADSDVALLDMVHGMLEQTYRAPIAIVLAELQGLHRDVLALPCTAETAHVVDRRAAEVNPFGRRRRVLAVSERHPLYRAARASDPRAGAAMLARILLLQYGVLDTPRSTLLLEDVLDRILTSRAGTQREGLPRKRSRTTKP